MNEHFRAQYPTIECVRIFPRGAGCAGCFNRHRLDPGRWDWCPEQQGAVRMFECTREIGSEQVIDAIDPWLRPGCDESGTAGVPPGAG